MIDYINLLIDLITLLLVIYLIKKELLPEPPPDPPPKINKKQYVKHITSIKRSPVVNDDARMYEKEYEELQARS